jgi:hypothetical protein
LYAIILLRQLQPQEQQQQQQQLSQLDDSVDGFGSLLSPLGAAIVSSTTGDGGHATGGSLASYSSPDGSDSGSLFLSPVHAPLSFKDAEVPRCARGQSVGVRVRAQLDLLFFGPTDPGRRRAAAPA